ncbi:4'-phosphopantetheinyl transferase superfamily protein [Cryobacterium sp. TMT1-21]|uniref:4'-phosphopantetheinyl transferase family protein n=1 Tax=unclassified Cryobacterium TaxID=2649013 RepID=UPI00106AFEC0|nr:MULTISPECIES: 4'-phosphopantetheinyl transferase superfamily protein [unclassified Cryobacterium]TFC84302.1 4'-phosphopantetheinyl transferase superfamily protein [Cryobacterium sp. TmT2-59]TFD12093.1 4'-phosphopantetheinyl transferase superfamily protein [Cryobacterium sp. TMT4-10]TFD17337.1 4'-phosphopantetheinyl transferase superfamily protein [Cryobacterium sp. TMT1-21]TFD17728.1 4'-phosphopantetheinyl transferase superfamily protein [Cryobacterium sp. TMT2-23]
MNAERTRDVFVVVAPRGATDAADRGFLAAAAAWVLGVDPRHVSIDRTCDRCGGSHGRPVLNVPLSAKGRTLHPWPLHASLSRAADAVAVALTFAGPVGVDIESLAAVSRADFDRVAFGAAEQGALHFVPPADAAAARAALWTAKEAILKCTGDGLRVDPRDLTVTLTAAAPTGAATDAAAPHLAAWPGAGFPLDTMRLARFDPGPGLAGTVAVHTDTVHTDTVHTGAQLTVLQLTATDIRRRPGHRPAQSLGSTVR